MAVERASVPVVEVRPHRKSAAREAQATLISLVYILPSLAAFTIFTADSRSITAWFVVGAVAAFLAFPLLARLLIGTGRRPG